MSLGVLLNRKAVTAGPKDSLAKAAELMKDKSVGAIVVVEQDRPVGIITDRDLALAFALHGALPSDPIQSRMMSPVETIRTDLERTLRRQKIRSLKLRSSAFGRGDRRRCVTTTLSDNRINVRLLSLPRVSYDRSKSLISWLGVHARVICKRADHCAAWLQSLASATGLDCYSPMHRVRVCVERIQCAPHKGPRSTRQRAGRLVA